MGQLLQRGGSAAGSGLPDSPAASPCCTAVDWFSAVLLCHRVFCLALLCAALPQLGLGTVGVATLGGFFGEGVGKALWLDEVRCRGSEDRLESCAHAGWGITNW